MTAPLRHATAVDADALTRVEAAADTMFEPLFGALDWEPEDGGNRLSADGFVLITTEDDEPVGFVHVLEADGLAHLEQLSVLPEHGGRGVGRALVEAACLHATALGHERITLRTFTDVPWNAPFYTTCGFVAIPDDLTPWHASLVDAERRLGLDRLGARVLMTRDLR